MATHRCAQTERCQHQRNIFWSIGMRSKMKKLGIRQRREMRSVTGLSSDTEDVLKHGAVKMPAVEQD
jgi:hypothetical protein